MGCPALQAGIRVRCFLLVIIGMQTSRSSLPWMLKVYQSKGQSWVLALGGKRGTGLLPTLVISVVKLLFLKQICP